MYTVLRVGMHLGFGIVKITSTGNDNIKVWGLESGGDTRLKLDYIIPNDRDVTHEREKRYKGGNVPAVVIRPPVLRDLLSTAQNLTFFNCNFGSSSSPFL